MISLFILHAVRIRSSLENFRWICVEGAALGTITAASMAVAEMLDLPENSCSFCFNKYPLNSSRINDVEFEAVDEEHATSIQATAEPNI